MRLYTPFRISCSVFYFFLAVDGRFVIAVTSVTVSVNKKTAVAGGMVFPGYSYLLICFFLFYISQCLWKTTHWDAIIFVHFKCVCTHVPMYGCATIYGVHLLMNISFPYFEQTVCECLLNLTLQQLRKYILYSFLTQNYITAHKSYFKLIFIKRKYKEASHISLRKKVKWRKGHINKLLNQNFIKILKMGKSFPFIHRLGFTKPLFSKGA